jgi:hypothetical protein
MSGATDFVVLLKIGPTCNREEEGRENGSRITVVNKDRFYRRCKDGARIVARSVFLRFEKWLIAVGVIIALALGLW